MTDSNVPNLHYLSTTIPYVNAPPHVGFALELLQTDAVARYQRLRGVEVRTSTGTDEYSLKSVRAADAAGVAVQALVAHNAAEFCKLQGALDAPFSNFIRTSADARHAATVERVLARCLENGDLYRRSYSGLYCTDCEQFYREEELAAGVCPEHGRPLETIAEENWFFRLSKYQPALLDAIESGRLRILPEERRQEALAFIRRGLNDFSVSRSAARAHGFGVAFPSDRAQVVYVWVDALCNYLTANDFAELGADCHWERAARRIQVLGKGVLRFHAVYWPALLLACGLRLPDELRVHGYLTLDGKKIGKSAGNALSPIELAERVGSDAVRYYLLRHIPAFKDADFSLERLLSVHDTELADELGNLALRVLTLTERHTASRFPNAVPRHGDAEAPLLALADALLPKLDAAIARHECGDAITHIFELVRASNRYLDLTAPWRLARLGAGDTEAHGRFENVVAHALAALRLVAVALSPFVPKLAANLASSLALVSGPLVDTRLAHWFAPGAELGPARPLVPRLQSRGGQAPRGESGLQSSPSTRNTPASCDSSTCASAPASSGSSGRSDNVCQ